MSDEPNVPSVTTAAVPTLAGPKSPPPDKTALEDSVRKLEQHADEMCNRAQDINTNLNQINEMDTRISAIGAAGRIIHASVERLGELTQDTEASLFRVGQTIENDLRDVARGAKSSLLGGLLREIVRLHDDIEFKQIRDAEAIRERIATMLELRGLYRVPIAVGDPFDPRQQKSIGTQAANTNDQHRTLADVKGSCWKREEDDSPFTYATVIVYQKPSPSQPEVES